MPSVVGDGRHRWLAMDANDGWQRLPTMVGKSCDFGKYI